MWLTICQESPQTEFQEAFIICLLSSQFECFMRTSKYSIFNTFLLCLFNESRSKSGFIARFDRIPDKFQYYWCSIVQNRTKGVSTLKGLKKRPTKQPKWKRLQVQRELSHVIHWKCTHIYTNTRADVCGDWSVKSFHRSRQIRIAFHCRIRYDIFEMASLKIMRYYI